MTHAIVSARNLLFNRTPLSEGAKAAARPHQHLREPKHVLTRGRHELHVETVANVGHAPKAQNCGLTEGSPMVARI
jgi:hypothetical protein